MIAIAHLLFLEAMLHLQRSDSGPLTGFPFPNRTATWAYSACMRRSARCTQTDHIVRSCGFCHVHAPNCAARPPPAGGSDRGTAERDENWKTGNLQNEKRRSQSKAKIVLPPTGKTGPLLVYENCRCFFFPDRFFSRSNRPLSSSFFVHHFFLNLNLSVFFLVLPLPALLLPLPLVHHQLLLLLELLCALEDQPRLTLAALICTSFSR